MMQDAGTILAKPEAAEGGPGIHLVGKPEPYQPPKKGGLHLVGKPEPYQQPGKEEKKEAPHRPAVNLLHTPEEMHLYENQDISGKQKFSFKPVTPLGAKADEGKNLAGSLFHNLLVGYLPHTGSKPLDRAADVLNYVQNEYRTGISSILEGAVRQVNNLEMLIPFPGSPTTEQGKRKEKETLGKALGGFDKMITTPNASELEKTFSFDLHKNTAVNNLIGALGGIAHMAPAIASSEFMGPTAFYLQGYNDADKEINQTEASPVAKFIYPMISGGVNAALMDLPVGKALDKAVSSKISSKLAYSALKESLEKSGGKLTDKVVQEAVQSARQTLTSRIKSAGVQGLKNAAHGAVFGAAMTGANIGTKAAVNLLSGKKIFDIKDVDGQFLNSIGQMALTTAVLGMGSTLSRAPVEGYIQKRISEAKTPEDVAALLQEVNHTGYAKGWTPEETEGVKAAVQRYGEMNGKLPTDIPPERKQEIYQHMEARSQAQAHLDELKSKKVDPALKGEQDGKIALAESSIQAINDQIREASTGNKYKYFEKDGIYYKQMGENSPEEITKNHYEIRTPIEQPEKPSEVKGTNVEERKGEIQQQIAGIEQEQANNPEGAIRLQPQKELLQNDHELLNKYGEDTNGLIAKLGDRIKVDCGGMRE